MADTGTGRSCANGGLSRDTYPPMVLGRLLLLRLWGAPSRSWLAGVRPGAPVPALGDLGAPLPWCPEMWDSGVPVASPAPLLSALCRVAEIGWIAGRVLPKPPAGFLFRGVTAGWGGGGAGALLEAGLSHPLAFSAALLLSQNSSRGTGRSSKPSWGSADRVLAQGLLCHPFPLSASQACLAPKGPSCSDILSIFETHGL